MTRATSASVGISATTTTSTSASASSAANGGVTVTLPMPIEVNVGGAVRVQPKRKSDRNHAAPRRSQKESRVNDADGQRAHEV